MSSKPLPWLGITGFVVAVAVAAGAVFYLRDVQETVEELAVEATTPPPVELRLSAPQLFPDETRIFVAVHGIDRSWADLDTWWKRFEPTANPHERGGEVGVNGDLDF